MRRWYQFHLSTALVLMFTASLFLWLNTRQYEDTKRHLQLFARGWPYAWYVHTPDQELSFRNEKGEVRATARYRGGRTYHGWKLAGNVGIALGILAAVGFIAERFARRRRTEGSG